MSTHVSPVQIRKSPKTTHHLVELVCKVVRESSSLTRLLLGMVPYKANPHPQHISKAMSACI